MGIDAPVEVSRHRQDMGGAQYQHRTKFCISVRQAMAVIGICSVCWLHCDYQGKSGCKHWYLPSANVIVTSAGDLNTDCPQLVPLLGMDLAEFFLQRAHDWLLPDMEVMIGLWIAIKLSTCGIKEVLGWEWELWKCRGIRCGVGQWKSGYTVDVIVLPYKNHIQCPTSLFLQLSSLNHHACLQFHHHC